MAGGIAVGRLGVEITVKYFMTAGRASDLLSTWTVLGEFEITSSQSLGT